MMHDNTNTAAGPAALVLFNVGDYLTAQMRLDDAIQCYRQAVVVAPEFSESHNRLGRALAQRGEFQEAAPCFRRAIELSPNAVGAYSNLGSVLAELGQLDEAVASFRQALEIDPELPATLQNLGMVLLLQGRASDAAPCFDKAIALNPSLAEAHAGIGDALVALGSWDMAFAHFRRAYELKPTLAAAQAGMGAWYQENGQLEAAQHHFEQAIALAPRVAGYHLLLSRVVKIGEDNPHLQAMLGLAKTIDILPIAERTSLHFALGNALAGTGHPQRAFEHFVAGNALKRSSLSYDEAAYLATGRRIAATFAADLLEHHAGQGDPSEAPVFIVGMPRSGTTLVEQILASHSRVLGTGETDALPRLLRTMANFPEVAGGWSGSEFREVGRLYLDGLRASAGRSASAASVARITDKMMTNFRHVGLIRLALPNARIIHIRRDPIDTCLSCFSIPFRNLDFAFDLGELGRAYKAYEQLMEHWRSVLPAGAILELRYEDLVENLETEARRLVAYCGLEWDDACLRFYEASHPARTASAVQVRQPIYRHAIGRWRPDAQTLRPLIEALAGN